MKKVKTTNQLKQMIRDGVHDFFILLNGGVRSSKFMDYNPQDGRFIIENEIDGSMQRLKEVILYNERYTNIGKAMRLGAFYAY